MANFPTLRINSVNRTPEAISQLVQTLTQAVGARKERNYRDRVLQSQEKARKEDWSERERLMDKEHQQKIDVMERQDPGGFSKVIDPEMLQSKLIDLSEQKHGLVSKLDEAVMRSDTKRATEIKKQMQDLDKLIGFAGSRLQSLIEKKRKDDLDFKLKDALYKQRVAETEFFEKRGYPSGRVAEVITRLNEKAGKPEKERVAKEEASATKLANEFAEARQKALEVTGESPETLQRKQPMTVVFNSRIGAVSTPREFEVMYQMLPQIAQERGLDIKSDEFREWALGAISANPKFAKWAQEFESKSGK